ILRSVYYEWKDDFVVTEDLFTKLDEDNNSVDLFIIGHNGLPQYPSIKIGERYKKPIAMIDLPKPIPLLNDMIAAVDITAYLKIRNLEGYAFLDFEEANKKIKLLKVRKALANTRILAANYGDIVPIGVLSSIYDFEILHSRFGLDIRTISASRIFENWENLSKIEREEASQWTQQFAKNSTLCRMTEENIQPSYEFYLSVKKELKKMQANAFTIPCFELCASKKLDKNKAVFCLAHSLLKDEGIISACEYDFNALLSMLILSHLSGKAPIMGNTVVSDKNKNIIWTFHDVVSLKMEGYNKQDIDYEVTAFTENKWGATIRRDFNKDINKIVTLLRFTPDAQKAVAVKGEIIKGDGHDVIGCANRLFMKITNAKLFHKLEQTTGHHYSIVFGDYTADILELGEIIGFETTII
ncbi:MAG: hypothetical protein J7L66_06035, partial [Anaerolineaceae bacterium]|nr:hypothetical protein [Anaerolineaceae bacterium]